jgi:hypothetical protein
MGSPKKKGLFKKPSSQAAAPSGGSFPVALSFGDNGMSMLLMNSGWFLTGRFSSNLRRYRWQLRIQWFQSRQNTIFAIVSKRIP